jgi:DNA invertase Pin-like site-specific DNA recombinase
LHSFQLDIGTFPLAIASKAVAYFRTSSETNVGDDKDSLKRQRAAVRAYAARAGYQVIAEYSDDGVKGADPVDQRPGFAAMLAHIAGNGVRTIIVETSSRFARDLIVAETGWRFLQDAGITLIAADSPDAFLGPTGTMVRQILGAVSQFEKAALVAKLKGARDRKKAATGKCGGRHSYQERDGEMVALAKKLARYPVNGRRRSLREVAAELEANGHVAASGKRYAATAVQGMIAA